MPELERVLTKQLETAYKQNKRVASAAAAVFDFGIDKLNDWRIEKDHNERMKVLAPEIENRLKQNLGVLLCSIYDFEEVTPGRKIPLLVNIYIEGEGNNANTVLSQITQSAFRPWDGRASLSSGGCSPERNPFCKRTRQYIWKTRYYMEVVKTVSDK